MAKITTYIPEPKPTYEEENQRQIIQSLDTVKNEQQAFNFFMQ
jgi:hypothetical protein